MPYDVRPPADRGMADSVLLIDVVRAALGRWGGDRWVLQPTEAWCQVTPPAGVARRHGWKLHVSATPLSAPIVLARSAEVLIAAGCLFKFGTDLRRVAELVGGRYDRGGGGKFITVYPRDDEQFRVLAAELHAVTLGLPGPRILSDKPFRPGSLVHYRYGEHRGERVFTDDGVFGSRLVAPDGTPYTDERRAWFSPPAWAPAPFPAEVATPATAPESVLLAGRFRVGRAVRHANKGGVYRAVDERDGTEVVVKQARAHVDAGLDGTDARDRLRAEARMLDLLEPLGIAPAKVALFEEQGDMFLAEEAVPGKPLHVWAAEHTRGAGFDVVGAVAIARRVVAVVRAVHRAGLVVGDLKPQNLMVTPFEEIRLIDVEHIAEQGRERLVGYTPGFAPPEIVRAAGPIVPEPSADCYSVGVTLFCVLTGLPPYWLSGRSGVRSPGADVAWLLAAIGRTHPVLVPFAELIAGLTRGDPAERWSLPRAEEFLTAVGQPPAPGALPHAPPGAVDRLLVDGVAFLRRSMTPHQATLWPRNPARHPDGYDPCDAWFGAAGVLAALTRAAQALGGEQPRESVARAAAWIDERLFDLPRLLPGLCHGRAGTAWALHDAASYLGDDRLAARAVKLAGSLLVTSGHPGVLYGMSGAGLAHLHLWQSTGDADLLDRALAYAEAVLAAARRTGDDWAWPVSADADSTEAGANHLGLGGVAGAGTFLLAAAQAAADHDPGAAPRLLAAATGAGDTLARAANVQEDRAWWPAEVGGGQPSRALWCAGPAGIGGFLIRLWAATGEQRYADLAHQAAGTVLHNPWHAEPGACCGLAGGGQYLLDLAEFTGEERYRSHAEGLAGIVHAQRTEHDGLVLTAEPADGAAYADGAAGILDFLIRLRHGGPHPWLPRHQHPPVPQKALATAAPPAG
jgi:tRNA A-37 threonylcarbamoyl transferase component Bud32